MGSWSSIKGLGIYWAGRHFKGPREPEWTKSGTVKESASRCQNQGQVRSIWEILCEEGAGSYIYVCMGIG